MVVADRHTLETWHAGRFRLLREIGRGGMGVVHEAFDTERQLRVALKLLTRLEPDKILRFKDEFRALRDLRQPNLVSLGDLVEYGGTWLFTMELIEGGNFLHYVRSRHRAPLRPLAETDTTQSLSPGSSDDREAETAADTTWHITLVTPGDRALGPLLPGPLLPPAEPAAPDSTRPHSISPTRFDERRLRQALRGLVQGLGALHRAGKVHRDVKPSNVLVDLHGRVVLLDFGVVAELSQERAFERGLLIGTIGYMAPEQALAEEIGPAADWYAVGGVLFRALTGRNPFVGTADEVLRRKCREDPFPPSTLVADVPPDLDRLCTLLLARRPEDRPGEEAILGALDLLDDRRDFVAVSPFFNVPAPFFVGRSAELKLLEERYEKTREGECAAVLLTGESGIGKSALIGHFVARQLELDPRLTVLQGRCHEREQVPYNAFDGIIDQLSRYLQSRGSDLIRELDEARELDGEPGAPPEAAEPTDVADLDTEHTQELLQVFPALRAVDSLEARVSLERAETPAPSQAARVRAFAALKTILFRLADRRPLILVIEDLQWADGDSWQLLDELTQPPAPPLLLLASYRPGGETSPLIGTPSALRRVALGGLPRAEAEALIAALAARHHAQLPADHTALVEESRGHPLFLDEMVQHLADGATHSSLASSEGSPVRVDDAIRARARVLPPTARHLLELLAVAGGPIPHATAARAAQLLPDQYALDMALLLQRRLANISGARQLDQIDTYHDRVREAVATQAAPNRAALQRELADALEATPGVDPGFIYSHLQAAGERGRAARYLDAAAAQAVAALAFGRAAELYREALRGDSSSDSAAAPRVPQQVQWLRGLAAALDNDGRPQEAAATWLEAAEQCIDPETRLDLLRRAAGQYLMGGHLESGLRVASTVLDQLGMTFPRSRARILGGIAVNQIRLSLTPLEWSVRREADVSPEARARIDACWSMGAGLAMVDVFLGAYFSSRGALLALEHGEPFRICRALSSAAISAAAMGRSERTRSLIAATARAAGQAGGELPEFYTRLARHAADFLLDNDWRACLDGATELLRIWRLAGRGQGWETDVTIHFACSCLQILGEWRELLDRVSTLVRDARRAGNRFLEVSLRTRFATVYLFEDNPQAASADVDNALASWSTEGNAFGNQRMWALWSRTRIALYTGAVSQQRASLEAEWKEMRHSLIGRLEVMQVEWRYLYGCFQLALGAVARERSSPRAELEAHAAEAGKYARLLVGMPYPVSNALASCLRAGAAAVRGQEALALSQLERAEHELEAARIHGYVAAVQRRRAQLMGGPQGDELRARSDRWFAAQGIASPARLTQLMMPGFAPELAQAKVMGPVPQP